MLKNLDVVTLTAAERSSLQGPITKGKVAAWKKKARPAALQLSVCRTSAWSARSRIRQRCSASWRRSYGLIRSDRLEWRCAAKDARIKLKKPHPSVYRRRSTSG